MKEIWLVLGIGADLIMLKVFTNAWQTIRYPSG